MKILSFDIEEWYLEKAYYGNHADRYLKFDHYLNLILDTLDSHQLKSTFFCVGGMAREFPQIVRLIADRGHEIGCHSDQHVWLTKLTREQAREDTHAAVSSLEQCLGHKVLSYRAPAFSIGQSNKWALEVLAECGISRDASIFPAVRDFGGFAEFGQKTPSIVKMGGVEIKEFPICTTHLLGKEVAYSGGGYFRFFPLNFIIKEMKASDYAMTYFHIEDLIPGSDGMMSRKDYEDYFKEPGTFFNRFKRYIKANLGKKGAVEKLLQLLAMFEFYNLEQADSSVNWDQVPIIEL